MSRNKNRQCHKILCPNCNKNKAKIDPVFGIILCKKCQDESKKVEINRTHEFTSSSIKGERKEFAGSMIQPYVNGVLSREFIERHGTSKLAGVTKKEIKNAKYVYKDLPRHHKIGDSK